MHRVSGHGDEAGFEEISWEDFFRKFDEAKLVVYPDDDDSRFSKLVSR